MVQNPTPPDSAYHRPQGCWFWLDGETFATPDVENIDPEKLIKIPGSSFVGTTRDGTQKSDPREALKDMRMGGTAGETGEGFNKRKWGGEVGV